MNILKTTSLSIVFLFGIASMLGSQSSSTRSSTPEPSLTSFTVGPPIVCLNQGIPLVQVSYEFDPDGWSNENTLCTQITANGQVVHPTLRHQCLDDGTTGNYTFNIVEQFGTNAPAEITVMVELLPLVSGDAYDSLSGTVTTEVACPPPGGLPNP